jgi:hypothetical protein
MRGDGDGQRTGHERNAIAGRALGRLDARERRHGDHVMLGRPVLPDLGHLTHPSQP